MRFIDLPAPDRGVPELRAFRTVVAKLTDELARGHSVSSIAAWALVGRCWSPRPSS
jgi:hypothetical protein